MCPQMHHIQMRIPNDYFFLYIFLFIAVSYDFISEDYIKISNLIFYVIDIVLLIT